ncbi:hypothetical protein Pelo_17948 [Pelomyxa schiedti]|nr:hypothetical protein Pelo_17948 [Pelomyxa schiedti]
MGDTGTGAHTPFQYVYEQEVDDLLLCFICKKALVDPVVHEGGCGEMACRGCLPIPDHGGTARCPMCHKQQQQQNREDKREGEGEREREREGRVKAEEDEGRGGDVLASASGSWVVAPRVIITKLNSLLVACPSCRKSVRRMDVIDHYNHCPTECPNGCGELVAPSYLETHNKTCLLDTVRCNQCLVSITRRSLPDHKMYCPIECPQGCGQRIAPKDQSAHNTLCPDAMVPCPFSVFLCKWNGKKKDQMSHTSKCTALRDYVVRLKKENLTFKEQVKTLTEANLALEVENEQLKNLIHRLTDNTYCDFVIICNKEEEIEKNHPDWTPEKILEELAAQSPNAYSKHWSRTVKVRHMRFFNESTSPTTRSRIQALVAANRAKTCRWTAEAFYVREWSWLTSDQQVAFVEYLVSKKVIVRRIPIYVARVAKKFYTERYKEEHEALKCRKFLPLYTYSRHTPVKLRSTNNKPPRSPSSSKSSEPESESQSESDSEGDSETPEPPASNPQSQTAAAAPATAPPLTPPSTPQKLNITTSTDQQQQENQPLDPIDVDDEEASQPVPVCPEPKRLRLISTTE